MLVVNGTKFTMAEGDFGETRNIRISSDDLLTTDTIKLYIKSNQYDNTLIEKEYTNLTITEEKKIIPFSLTEEESSLLSEGNYIWGMTQYRGTTLVSDIPLDGNTKFFDYFIVEKGI